MKRNSCPRPSPATAPRLCLFDPDPKAHRISSGSLMISGFPASIRLYTPEQWAEAAEHPADAIHLSCGSVIVLRIA